MNKRKIAVAAVGITGLLTGTVCASQAIADPSGPGVLLAKGGS